jgi:small subunit ribosomal protein S2
MIDFRKLIKAGVHFGHEDSRWFPAMAPYIWGKKNKIHLIDVSKTAFQLERAAKFLESVAAEGKQILFVGTKRAAQSIIEEIAKKLNMPYVNHRWVGGTLNNYAQVKKSVTRLLHYEDIIARAEKYPHYTKKELSIIQKNIERLQKNVGGIRTLNWPIGAVVLIDVAKEKSALKEAASVGIPVVGLVDTNGDPSLVDYVIPANDDAPSSIKVIIEYLAEAVERGKRAAAGKGDQVQVIEIIEEQQPAIFGLEEEEDEEGRRGKKASSDVARSVKKTKKTTHEEVSELAAEKKSPKKMRTEE